MKRAKTTCLVTLAGAGVLFTLLAVLSQPASAQGCAMCYQNAAATGARGQAALRHGILILLIPALGLFAGIFWRMFRRNSSDAG